MARGAMLGLAADAAVDALRLILHSRVLLNAANAVISEQTEADFDELVEDASQYAAQLVAVADRYGHAQVAKRFQQRERAA